MVFIRHWRGRQGVRRAFGVRLTCYLYISEPQLWLSMRIIRGVLKIPRLRLHPRPNKSGLGGCGGGISIF